MLPWTYISQEGFKGAAIDKSFVTTVAEQVN